MSEGAAPVDPDEPILRRIPAIAGYYDNQKAPPVGAGAFRPSSKDTDGLSFYLERKVSAEELASSGTSGSRYAVARFRAADLYACGLTLVPDQQPGDLPGHLILPQINLTTYNDPKTKAKLKEICRELSRIASMNLVLVP